MRNLQIIEWKGSSLNKNIILLLAPYVASYEEILESVQYLSTKKGYDVCNRTLHHSKKKMLGRT